MKTDNHKPKGVAHVGSSAGLGVGLTSKESESFVRLFNNPDTAKTVRETYREVGVGIYESNAKRLSKLHQKSICVVSGTLYRIGDFLNRHRLTRSAQYILNLGNRFRIFIWDIHIRKNVKDTLPTPNDPKLSHADRDVTRKTKQPKE